MSTAVVASQAPQVEHDFWAEKQRSHDDEEILSVEECLQVM
jgi:hypothetical protein